MFVKTTDFYGFERKRTEEMSQKCIIQLNAPSPAPIYLGDTEAEVVEEIIRRKGLIFDCSATYMLGRVQQTDDRCCSAEYDFLKGEKKPPWLAKKNNALDCVSLSPVQYLYAEYLKEQIKNGNLNIKDIKQRRPGRKTIWYYYHKYKCDKRTPKETIQILEEIKKKLGETTIDEYLIKNGITMDYLSFE